MQAIEFISFLSIFPHPGARGALNQSLLDPGFGSGLALARSRAKGLSSAAGATRWACSTVSILFGFGSGGSALGHS